MVAPQIWGVLVWAAFVFFFLQVLLVCLRLHVVGVVQSSLSVLLSKVVEGLRFAHHTDYVVPRHAEATGTVWGSFIENYCVHSCIIHLRSETLVAVFVGCRFSSLDPFHMVLSPTTLLCLDVPCWFSLK